MIFFVIVFVSAEDMKGATFRPEGNGYGGDEIAIFASESGFQSKFK